MPNTNRFNTIMHHLMSGEVYWNHLTGEVILYDPDYDSSEASIERVGYETFCLTIIDLARSVPIYFAWNNDNDVDIPRTKAVRRIMDEDGWHLSRPYTDKFYLKRAKEA